MCARWAERDNADVIQKFKTEYRLNPKEVKKYKRYRKGCVYSFLAGILALGLLVALLVWLASQQAVIDELLFTGLSLTSLSLLLLSAYYYARLSYSTDFSSEDIAGYELAKALHEYESEHTHRIEETIEHLKEAQNYLFVGIPSRIRPETSVALQNYIYKIQDANDSTKELEKTFDELKPIIAFEFTATHTSEIEELTSRVEDGSGWRSRLPTPRIRNPIRIIAVPLVPLPFAFVLPTYIGIDGVTLYAIGVSIVSPIIWKVQVDW